MLASLREQAGAHHGGGELRESEAAWAGQLAARERKRLGLTEAELKRRRKGDAKKLQVARLLRRETTMSLNWIAQRLKMGAAGSLANRLRREERN
ncbi:MAG: hypothetical protein JWR19_2525 [Pedosphaera sp.]|nr:hypothetical protein [Pedosphaera sp.]